MGFLWQFGELIFNGETLAARNASIEAQVGRWLIDPLQRGRDLGNTQPPLGVRENQVCRLRVDRSHDMTPNGLWYSARSIFFNRHVATTVSRVVLLSSPASVDSYLQ